MATLVGKVKNLSGADLDFFTGHTLVVNQELEITSAFDEGPWLDQVSVIEAAITAGDIEVRDKNNDIVPVGKVNSWIISWRDRVSPTVHTASLDGVISGPSGTIQTLQMSHVQLSEAGFYLPKPGTLKFMTLTTEKTDPDCNYDLILFKNPTSSSPTNVKQVNLGTGNRILDTVDLDIALTAGEYGLALKKNCGTPTPYHTFASSLGPVAYYRFGEASGTVAVDETTNHNGTYIGSPELGVKGRIEGNTAVDFSGYKERMEAGTWNINGTGLSLVTWFRADKFAKDSFDCLICKGNGAYQWSLELHGSTNGKRGKLRFRVRANSDIHPVETPFKLGRKIWYLVAATFDESNGAMKIYVNGVEVASTTHVQGASSVGTSTDQIQFGANGNTREFNGVLDEGMIFDKPVTQQNVIDLYNKAELVDPPESNFSKAIASIGVLLNG